MEEKDIIEGNKLLADLMEFEYKPFPFNSYFYNGIDVGELSFHSDWNWLMKVVEKIESLGYFVHILGLGCFISTPDSGLCIDECATIVDPIIEDNSKLIATWKVCVEFVERINSLKYSLNQ